MNLALVQPWCSIGSDGSALAIEGPVAARAIRILAASGPFRACWAFTFAIAVCCGWRTQCGR